MSTRHAIIMAGGSGERFWPASTKERPKQLLTLAGGDKTLLDQAVERAHALAGENVWLATLGHLVEPSLAACPALKAETTLVEPMKRGTAGCLIWAAASLAADAEDWRSISVAVLTADHRIGPLADFAATASDAYDLAESGGLAVIGIRPTRPETGFGYIEVGAPRGPGAEVKQFREKPDSETAKKWVEDGGFLWNSGMFFWTLGAFADELEHSDADVHAAFLRIKDALAAGDKSGAEEAFALLPDTSIDYLLMEKARQVSVVESRFEWDDLGSWDALERSLPADKNGNAVAGSANLLDSSGCIVAGFSGQRISVLGCDDLVIAAVEGEILVMPKSRAQEVKRLIPRKPDGQS